MGIGILNALFRQEVEYRWPRELSSMRVLGLAGHFRALHWPEALCFVAFWRLGRASARGASPQGLNRMGSDPVRDASRLVRSCLVKVYTHLATMIRSMAIRTMFSAVLFKIP
jgi:hypothetical protein